jgi:diguanylate cyclase (GGDEF)-like protein
VTGVQTCALPIYLYGHVAGDDCLRGVAQVLKKTLQRQQDLAFRYGGEEFSCLLPDTDLEGAEKVAEEIRLRVEGLKIPHDGSKAHRYLTVSIGVATVDGASSMTEREIFKQCDNLLYRAKQFGRNRVVCRQ